MSLVGIDRLSGTESVNPLLDVGHIELASRVAHVTIFHDDTHRARLILPVVPQSFMLSTDK